MPLVNKTFDQLLDFTRTTAATFVGSNGLIQNTAASRNLLTFTQEFDNAAWSKGATTVTANSTVAPDGTSTADTLVANGVNATHIVAPPVVSTGFVRTFSIYLKAGTNSFAQVYFDGDVAPFANFNLSTGAVGTTGSNQTATITDVGNGWYRCTIYTSSLIAGRPVVLITASASAVRNEANTLATSIFIWGAQLEAASAATDYTRNNGGVFPPRFDYDPVTLAPKGLLVEEQRVNLLVRSAEFDNASWVLGSATITANSTTSPDGTTNADTLTSAAATAATYAQQSFTATAVAHTFSLYVKANGARYIQLLWAGTLSTNYANFDLTTATVTAGTYTSASITSAANGWFRVNITSTLAAAAGAVNVYLIDSGTAARAATYTGDGTSGIFLYGAQLEAGAFATSYIPTVASQVTRTADQCAIVAPNFAPWYNQSEGTFVAQFSGTGSYALAVNDGTSANYNAITYINPTSVRGVTVVGATYQFVQMTGGAAGTVNKTAYAYKLGDLAGSTNGGVVATSTSTVVPTGTQMLIGTFGGFGQLNGHIRSIRYYPTRLSNAQLQALTA